MITSSVGLGHMVRKHIVTESAWWSKDAHIMAAGSKERGWGWGPNTLYPKGSTTSQSHHWLGTKPSTYEPLVGV
jgi:hypothetical protein